MNKSANWQQLLPQLAPNAHIHTLEKNQQYAMNCEYIIIVLSGKMHLYAYCPEIQEPFLVDYLQAGKWISNTQAPLYLTLHGHQSAKFLCLNQQQVNQICKQHVDFTAKLLHQISAQQQLLLQRLCWQKLSSCERVAALLTQLLSEHTTLDLSHSELAMMLGTSRETVSRSLERLAKQGQIHHAPRHIQMSTA